MYRCCIFDLDGTLLNTLESLKNTVNGTLSHFGLEPLDEAQIRGFVGDGYKMLVERVLKYSKDKDLQYYEPALKIYMSEFAIHYGDEVVPYDGICVLLEYLKSNGIQIAVLSNKPHEMTVANIHEVFGEGYFDLVMGEQTGIKRKPDPEGLHRIMIQLGLRSPECLYIGDTGTDMETGKAAGVDTVGVRWGFRGLAELGFCNPQYLVGCPEEIIEIVKRRAHK